LAPAFSDPARRCRTDNTRGVTKTRAEAANARPSCTFKRKARFMQKNSLLYRLGAVGIFVVAVSWGAAVPAYAAEDDVIARVNGEDITQLDIDVALEDIGDTLPDMSDAERRDYLITYLSDLQLVSEAARAAGIADDPAFKRRMEYLQQRNLMESYLAGEGDAAASEEEAHKLYDSLVGQLPEEPRVRARHILVETEDEAKEIRKQLDEGADFAEIAKEKSSDPGSGADGGDLGWFTAEQMVPEFSAAAFALEPGEVSEPVKSDFGWHIIKVDEKRNKPGFDEVEDEIYDLLTRQRQRDIIMSLREGAKIERLDQPAQEATDGDGTDSSKEGSPKKKAE
jgi:peptidyl-prolyl cis-trans isomerase C